MEEKWEHIKGYEGLYKVSNCGRIASLPHVTHRGFCTVTTPLVILTPRVKDNGYLFVSLSHGSNESVKQKYVHRLVAEAFIPNPCGKKEVDHIDGDRKNNVVTNLRWATRLENVLNENTVHKNAKKIRVSTKDNIEIGIYSSMTSASKTLGVSRYILRKAMNQQDKEIKFLVSEIR